LNFPESGLRVSVTVHNGTWQTTYWFHDEIWYYYDPPVDRECWVFDYEYYHPKGVPGFSIERCTAEYDDSSGTMTLLFSRHLRYSETAEINGLQMKSGECWVMGFNIEIGIHGQYYLEGYYTDG